ncbi:MAG: TPM domain-containing protein [Crocinitomicaceae bacterium]|nr:TPM domain-containing protein [Crocinitomicaceae bacterium]
MHFSKNQVAKIKEEIVLAEKNTSGEIRIHLDKKCSADPVEAAIKVFETLGMTNTKDRNGVLIYLAINDKKMAIIGDTGIDKKVPEDFWESVKNTMVENFKEAKFVEGICEAIKESGMKLSTYFPYQSDDENELSDEISIGEGT